MPTNEPDAARVHFQQATKKEREEQSQSKDPRCIERYSFTASETFFFVLEPAEKWCIRRSTLAKNTAKDNQLNTMASPKKEMGVLAGTPAGYKAPKWYADRPELAGLAASAEGSVAESPTLPCERPLVGISGFVDDLQAMSEGQRRYAL